MIDGVSRLASADPFVILRLNHCTSEVATGSSQPPIYFVQKKAARIQFLAALV
jgi:hypothetical protein